MKNNYCDLTREQIEAVPERFKGFFESPFQYNLRNEFVAVPEDTFREMIAIIAEYATRAPLPAEQPSNQVMSLESCAECNGGQPTHYEGCSARIVGQQTKGGGK